MRKKPYNNRHNDKIKKQYNNRNNDKMIQNNIMIETIAKWYTQYNNRNNDKMIKTNNTKKETMTQW